MSRLVGPVRVGSQIAGCRGKISVYCMIRLLLPVGTCYDLFLPVIHVLWHVIIVV